MLTPATASSLTGPVGCRQLDELLFAPTGWFCIDARNRRVPGVTPGTLDQALALVGQREVATVVGQLRPEAVGVDVDATGALGDEAAAAVTDWCAARGLWHLQRPSGGADGRWHVFLVPGVHHDDLVDYVAAVRRELRLTGRQLDVRRQLRPLSAPHRRTGPTPPLDGLAQAQADLQEVLAPLPVATAARRRATRTPRSSPDRARTVAGGPDMPLTPLRRRRRDLPPVWAAYLDQGRTAAAAVDRDPHSRSQLELEATTQLVLAGYTEPQAWAAITAAHPTAFPKARARGRRWWWHTWNRCVHDLDAWLRTQRATTPPPTTTRLVATDAARAALHALWLTWPARTRHTDVEILTVVLDRMDRLGAAAVAIPQRDLVLDCAIASRTTVRAALARLQATGLLQVHQTYVPGTTDTAHTLALPDHLPELGQVLDPDGSSTDLDGIAVSSTGPSSFQPPQPLPRRRALGLSTCAVLRALPAPAGPPVSPAVLAQRAGLLEHGHLDPTPAQLRTLRSHLRRLAHHGLAGVDGDGAWHATPPAAIDQVATDLEDVGRAAHTAVVERIADERAEFRTRCDPSARQARWARQRDSALAAAAKAATARQRAWWTATDPHDRAALSRAHATAFAALPPPDQAARKDALARRRARTGEHERVRHSTWLGTLSPDELAARSAERAATFATRPAHIRQQLVASWAEHRARWQLPHHRRHPLDR